MAQRFQPRFPADLSSAFKAWIVLRPFDNPAAPPSPFEMAAYQPEGLARAGTMEARTEEAFAAGQRANRTSDSFTRGAVILALAMFFEGIGQVFNIRAARLTLLLMAVICCTVGLLQIAALPSLSLR